MKRRSLIKGLLGVGAAAGVGYWWLNRRWDGYLKNPCLAGLPESIKQSELWQQIWIGLNPSQIWDTHSHIVGTGDLNNSSYQGEKVWFNPNLQSWGHPVQHLQYKFYMDAICAADPSKIDRSYSEQLLQLLDQMPQGMKLMLMAFDYHHTEQGLADKHSSTFHVPNDYASWLASEYSEYFEWVASIHPYQKDALSKLEKAIESGAVAVKWLPPAHNIDPMDARCDDFYKLLAKYDLPLISHAGIEKAVKSEDSQKFSNPLRLRRPLDHGVRVVAAHCASLGKAVDLDNANKSIEHFDLFARMMGESQYKHSFFGDLSACTQINRQEHILKTLLTETSWHERLLNGSDYPLPAVMPLISVKKLIKEGVLDEKWSNELNQIRQHNALLFDFALKRLLQYRGNSFASSVFESRRVFDPMLRSNP